MYTESIFSYRQTLTQLSDSPCIVDVKHIKKPHLAPYGTVLNENICPIDPVEAGAIFHEDALLDRPRFATAFRRIDYLHKLNIFFMFITCGLWFLLCHWFSQYAFLLTHRRTTFENATHVVISTEEGAEYESELIRIQVSGAVAEQHDCYIQNSKPTQKYSSSISKQLTKTFEDYPVDSNTCTMYIFQHKLVRYYLNLIDNCFEVAQFDTQYTPDYIHRNLASGLTRKDLLESRKLIFGNIDYPKFPVWKMCIEELLEPFFMLQLASVALWLWDEYIPYALLVLGVMILTSAYDIKASKLHEKRLFSLFKNVPMVNVFRIYSNSGPTEIEGGMQLYSNEKLLNEHCTRIIGTDILPGDLFEVEDGMSVPCDAILLCGTATVLETNLTGETSHVLKTALPLPNVYPEDNVSSSSSSSSASSFSSYTSSSSSQNGLTSTTLSQKRPLKNMRNDNGSLYIIDEHDYCTLFGSTKVINTIKPVDGSKILALAVRTSFLSRYGRLIRSILFPMKTRFQFNNDAISYLKYLFLYTTIGLSISIFTGLAYRFPSSIIIIRTLDLFTTSIPPALPAALCTGIIIVSNRLRRLYGIFCWNLGRVNLAGLASNFVFDKTRTITEPDLHFVGQLNVENVYFEKNAIVLGRKNLSINNSYVKNLTANKVPKQLKETIKLSNLNSNVNKVNSHFTRAAATCHNAMIVNSILVADSLDMSILRMLNWSVHNTKREATELYELAKTYNQSLETPELNEKLAYESIIKLYDSNNHLPTIIKPPNVELSIMQLLRKGYSLPLMKKTVESWNTKTNTWNQNAPPETINLRQYFPNGFSELGIVKKFKFNSGLQRMCVIVRDPLTQELYSFVKGSPEMISEICKSCTIPVNFFDTVHEQTKYGIQIIAYAGKSLGRLNSKALGKITRIQAESKLTLLGCFAFSNKIKPEAFSVLNDLTDAGCRCILATGDHPLTTIAVAKDWGLLTYKNYQEINVTLPHKPRKEIILGDLYVSKKPVRDNKHREFFVWTKIVDDHSNNEINSPHTKQYKEESDIQKILHNRVISARTRQLTTFDLKDFLRGKNPLDFEIVVTGRAFRKLRMLHEEMKLPWYDSCLSFNPSSHTDPTLNQSVKERDDNVESINIIRHNLYPVHQNLSHLIGKFELELMASSKYEEETVFSKYPSIDEEYGFNLFWLINPHSKNQVLKFKIKDRIYEKSVEHLLNKNLFCSNIGIYDKIAKFWTNQKLSSLNSHTEIWRELSKTFLEKSTIINSITTDYDNQYEQPFLSKNNNDSMILADNKTSFEKSTSKKHCPFLDKKSIILSVVSVSKKQVLLDNKSLHKRYNNTYNYELLQMSLFEFILRNTNIYTRMSPEDKTSLITSLRNLPGQPVVGMCGESSNDYGALAAADVGIAVANNQASIAAAYHTKSLSGVKHIVRECRSALSVAIRIFQFIVLYSIIQYSSTAILYIYGSNLTDYQCLFEDFFIILPLSLSMMTTPAPLEIPKNTPNSNLCTKSIAGKILVHSLWAVLTEIALVYFVQKLPGWFEFQVTPEAGDSSGPEIASYENTLIFLLTNFQYIATCFVVVSPSLKNINLKVNLISYSIMSVICIFNVTLIYAKRPHTVPFPSYENPSPTFLVTPKNTRFLEKLLIFADQSLFLVNLPSIFKHFLLSISIIYYIGIYIIEKFLIVPWEEQAIKTNDLYLKIHNGPIINNNLVYHVL